MQWAFPRPPDDTSSSWCDLRCLGVLGVDPEVTLMSPPRPSQSAAGARAGGGGPITVKRGWGLLGICTIIRGPYNVINSQTRLLCVVRHLINSPQSLGTARPHGFGGPRAGRPPPLPRRTQFRGEKWVHGRSSVLAASDMVQSRLRVRHRRSRFPSQGVAH